MGIITENEKDAVSIIEGDDEEIVTCIFVADDWIDEVYYNNNDVRKEVKNASNPATTKKELKFKPQDGGVLAIATNDNEPGTSAVFCFKCSSTNPNSYWNFELNVRNARLYKVRANGVAGSNEQHGPMKRSLEKVPHKDWYKNDFDDSSWGFPTEPTNDFLAKSHQMSGVWFKEYKYSFYRFNPKKVSVKRLAQTREKRAALDKQASSFAKKQGYTLVDMKCQMSFDEQIEDIPTIDPNIDGEVVKCQFVADGKVDKVYYANTDRREEVQNVHSAQELLKTFVFTPTNNDVLAISANGKAFGFQCTSTNPDSYWNFDLDTDNCRLLEVRSWGTSTVGQDTRKKSLTESLIPEWYMKSFDDSSWECPSQPTNDFITKFHHMSRVWYRDCKHAFFRFNPHKVDLERLAKERKEKAALSETIGKFAQQQGFNIVGLKFQKDEETQVSEASEKAYPPIKDDRPINRKVLNYIADQIAIEWKTMGRQLGLDEAKIETIQADYVSTYERAVQCQNAWMRMTPNVSWSDLRNTLVEIRRNDIVRDVEQKFEDLLIKDFETYRTKTFYTKRRINIDTSTRLDTCEDRNRFPKIYPGIMLEGLEEIKIAAKTFFIENDEHRKKLRENANLMYELRKLTKCPNIVNIVDIYEEEPKQFFLIIERCDFDLKQYLGFYDKANSEIPVDLIAWTKTRITSLQIARDILNGLEYVHSNHHGSTFMHRDIKPSNILFKVCGEHIIVKISDFGISKKSEFSRNFTTTCLDKGTDLYTPLDIRDKARAKANTISIVDLKMADMFAFGVTLHQLVTNGDHPFQGKSDTWTSCNMEEGTRTKLYERKDKTLLNLIYNLTESKPSDRLHACELKSYHPWFFDDDKIITCLRDVDSMLSDPVVDAKLKENFEEPRHLFGDWRKKLPNQYNEKVKTTTSNPWSLEPTLKDLIRFNLLTIDCTNNKDDNSFRKYVYGQKQPANHELIEYLMRGENALFPHFLIHIYCKAAQVFPGLSFVDNSGAKKIRESYRRYLADVTKEEPCSVPSNNKYEGMKDVKRKNSEVNKKDGRMLSWLKNVFR